MSRPNPVITPKVIQRFYNKVCKLGGDSCWEWIGYRRASGYGLITIQKRHYVTHRIAWLIAHGSLPPDLCVCHHCDNPACVRPSHLWLGTSQENLEDMYKKGRHAGSKYHPTKLPNPTYFKIDL